RRLALEQLRARDRPRAPRGRRARARAASRVNEAARPRASGCQPGARAASRIGARMKQLLAILLVACGSSGGGGAGGGPDGNTGSLPFQAFAPATRSVGFSSSDERQLSVTDGVGAIACGLSRDPQASLGSAG